MNIYILYIASAVLAHPLLPGCIIFCKPRHAVSTAIFGGCLEADMNLITIHGNEDR
jgi:hypothetical protein